jgi:hypothetical protein
MRVSFNCDVNKQGKSGKAERKSMKVANCDQSNKGQNMYCVKKKGMI